MTTFAAREKSSFGALSTQHPQNWIVSHPEACIGATQQ